jgi:hypothetical protein
MQVEGSRTDVNVVGPLDDGTLFVMTFTARLETSEDYRFVALGVNRSQRLIFSEGAISQSIIEPGTEPPLLYFRAYQAAPSVITGNNVRLQYYIAVYDNPTGTRLLGWLLGNGSGNWSTSSTTTSANIITMSTDFPATYTRDAMLTGVRYTLNIKYTFLYCNSDQAVSGLCDGTEQIDDWSSSVVFLPLSSFTGVNCAPLVPREELSIYPYPDIIYLFQCLTQNNTRFSQSPGCFFGRELVAYTTRETCQRYLPLGRFNYGVNGSIESCGADYNYTNFEGVKSQAINPIGSCPEGLTCLVDQDGVSCQEPLTPESDDTPKPPGDNLGGGGGDEEPDRTYRLGLLVLIGLIVLLIIIIVIVAVVASRSKPKTHS